MDLNPKEDGITHINAWSRGKTELGQLLSNFAHTPFQHPVHGYFASVEAFWYWAASGRSHNELRRLYGASAKSVGSKLESIPMPEEEFHEMIREAFRLKLAQNDRLRNLLISSTLPIEHYFVYGGGGEVVIKKDKHRWQTDYWQELRTLHSPAGKKAFAERHNDIARLVQLPVEESQDIKWDNEPVEPLPQVAKGTFKMQHKTTIDGIEPAVQDQLTESLGPLDEPSGVYVASVGDYEPQDTSANAQDAI